MSVSVLMINLRVDHLLKLAGVRPTSARLRSAWRVSSRREVMSRGFSTLPPPSLRFANEEHAALNPERGGIFEHDIGVIGLAVFRIINLACPLVCALRSKPGKDLQADNRSIAPAGIDVMDVGFGLAGLRIIRLPKRGDGGAEPAAAVRHAHRCILFGTPSARRINSEARNRGYAQ